MALQIRLLSQGVVIHNPPGPLVYYLENTIHPTLVAPKLARDRGKFYVEDGDPYFYIDKVANDYYYHLKQLEAIKGVIELAQSRGQLGEVEYIKQPTSVGSDIKFKNYRFDLRVPEDNPDIFDFYGFQNEVSDTACEPDRYQTIFEIQTGRGKSLSQNMPVLTPTGWREIGDLKVGDYVIGRNGKPTKVIGVYPQGELDIYNFETYDQRSVEVCGNHLWESFYVNTTENRRWAVRNTEEIKRLIAMPNPRVYIPLCNEVEFVEQKDSLPLDPYTLGLLIGDGSFVKPPVNFNSPDMEIVEHIGVTSYEIGDQVKYKWVDRSNCYSGSVVSQVRGNKSKTLEILSDLKLLGCYAWDKFIPEQYMSASIEERWQLVRGLMDTDGTVNKDGGQPSFCTSSEKLATQLQELVRSLGGIARISTKTPYFTYKGERKQGRPAYIVFMRHPTPSKLFNLDRQKEKCRDQGQYTDILKVRVKSIEPAGKKECVCIKVEAEDELFITKDYLVTHNTKSFQKVMVRLGKRTCIIVRPAYKMKWKQDCVDDETGLYEPGPRVRVVSGVDGIDAILHDGKTGDLDKKNISTIIIPTTSLKLWLEAHSKSFGANRINLWEFFDILGVGLVGYDEIHEHFHTVYLSGMILNPPKLVEMSATLKPSKSKEFIRHRYLERFPLKNRVDVPYIRVCQIGFFYYSLNCQRMVNRTNAMAMYNHKTFEDYLYQHDMLGDYFDMVYDIMERGFFKSYQKGQRVLVFFSLIQTCTDFRDYLEKRMKAEGKPELEVNRYVGDDKYDDLMTSDIAVSTPGKAGTAVDLPGLVMAIVTTAIDDRQLNEQIAGRPRRITQWEGVTPRVIFLHAREIKKHNAYLASRKTALTPVAKSLDIIHAGYTVVGNEQENRFLSPTKSAAQKATTPSKQKKTMDRYRKMQSKKDRFRKRKNKRFNRKRRR